MPNLVYLLLRRLRLPLIVLILIYALSVLGFVLIPGRDNDGNVWMMSYFHAFYFVSYMASTIGFGEIPYAFTDAQRLWATFTIYASVIGWLYSIGAMLAVLQDAAFARLRREASFQRRVRALREPFYLVCGYGDTGSMLVRALEDEGMRAVVIDREENRINELELTDSLYRPLCLTADAAKPAVLEKAGVLNPYCKGVIALTDSDQANLLIALSTELFRPELRLLARAENADMEANIRSFGKNEVVNPFELFAERLELALNAPSHYTLNKWLTGVPHQALSEPLFPRKGLWILVGFGRFGQALYRRMKAAGLHVRVIEAHPQSSLAPEDMIQGVGTEEATLTQAGIREAVGIVAGTNDDATNLSALMTARELNRSLFIVARQNQRDNAMIFERAKFQLVMKRGEVIAHKIFALLRTPLVSDFLELSAQQDEAWANLLISRILGVTDDEVPYLWEIRVTVMHAPALYRACMRGERVLLRHLTADPQARELQLPVLTLLIKRSDGVLLLPTGTVELHAGDRLLMCATRRMYSILQWAVQNEKALHYLLKGTELVGSPLLRQWLGSK